MGLAVYMRYAIPTIGHCYCENMWEQYVGAILARKMKCEDFLMNRYEPSRTRTCDPLVKSQLLYRLSYRPTWKSLESGV
jgi:hypothetical protein